MTTATVELIQPGALKVAGSLESANAVVIEQQGRDLMSGDNSVTAWQIDLSGITACSSVGLSVLLCWLRFAKKSSYQLKFINMSADLFDLARVSGLDSVLPLGIE
ncbi:STAS domain-containing protein [Zooshikella marina]|uniref:STAS domain-containing protein n=1 Tax=Zooshikella ganghwensis TaxID=202772 RepID=UPI001BAFD72F|nr:STAS domain-containing protein [Zooshikella ganghwensis]MBU2705487.1 STAS domain-containing protein [Zooshikella ganghwensis]